MQHADGWLNDPLDLTDYFHTHRTKQSLFRAIPKIVQTFDARLIALMLSAWVMPLEPNADGSTIDMMDRPEAHEHPERREELQVIVANATRIESWAALIKRGPFGGPELEPWQHTEPPSGGVLIDELRKAWT